MVQICPHMLHPLAEVPHLDRTHFARIQVGIVLLGHSETSSGCRELFTTQFFAKYGEIQSPSFPWEFLETIFIQRFPYLRSSFRALELPNLSSGEPEIIGLGLLEHKLRKLRTFGIHF